jgi:hypothetical protein
MELSNEIENVWKEARAREAGSAPVTGKDFQEIISSRVRKELKTVGQFVWAAIVYQIILYSFLTHTFIRHWGDMQIMLLCLVGAALYSMLTVALIRRVRKMYQPSNAPGASVPDVFHKVEGDYARLADFFQFKKRMDWIGVPVSCAIIVLITFTLFVGGCPSLLSMLKIRSGLFLRSAVSSRFSMISKIRKRPKSEPECHRRLNQCTNI